VAIYLGDINTRARGLRTRLLKPLDLGRLAHARSLFGLQREFGALGLAPADTPATSAGLERAVRQRAAGLMAILGRWCADERQAILAVILDDEDRRSILSILRGAEQGTASDTRLSGLVPTMHLSERALGVLAAQPTMADVVRMLVLWNHPFGTPLVDAVSGARPSLFEVEVALQRAFAGRALLSARKAGRHLVDYARQLVDVMNAWSALLHFPERDPAIVDLTFVEGGAFIDREAFRELLALASFDEVREQLGRLLRGSSLAKVFTDEPKEVASLETAVLRAQLEEQNHAARMDPEGTAPLISFALGLRAEALNLRRIIWGVALEAPAALLEAEVVAR
jgi:vacuolar-type H+-ATPase subunit C/Vma6